VIALDGATNRRSWQQLQTPVGSLHACVSSPNVAPSSDDREIQTMR